VKDELNVVNPTVFHAGSNLRAHDSQQRSLLRVNWTRGYLSSCGIIHHPREYGL